MNFETSADCSGRLCGYGAFDGSLGCSSGSGSCWEAVFLEADTSTFHDSSLQEATERIKAILSDVPPDLEGRKLSFVHTKKGTLLAWVQHGLTFPDGAVTYDSPQEEVERVLKIKSYSAV